MSQGTTVDPAATEAASPAIAIGEASTPPWPMTSEASTSAAVVSAIEP